MVKQFQIAFTFVGKRFTFKVNKLHVNRKKKTDHWLVWNDSMELELESNMPSLIRIPGEKNDSVKWTILKGEPKPSNIIYNITEEISKHEYSRNKTK